ncbi:LolA family protein [Microbacterium sp.]|uniref:LolA family protein n=1 Tax=Microbacterium sp. TaxID=51671 RepID=UPI003A8F58A1
MPFRKGLIPAIVAPLAVVVGMITVPAIANAATPPAAKTPAQVLALVADSHDAHYSGTVQQSSDLGLPQLPDSMSSSASASSQGFDAASIISLVTGSHTAKVYVDGPTRQRVQLLDTLSERDLIHDGTSVWTYDATAHTATHATASSTDTHSSPPQTRTPAMLADRFIAAITPTTSVTASTGTFLGRGVYELTLAPKTSVTLIGDVLIRVDAQTGVPLSVQVDARGQSDPAVEVTFSAIDFARPAADVFTFTPPAGTTVKSLALPSGTSGGTRPDAGTMTAPTVIGTGWASIVKVSGKDAAAAPGAVSSSAGLLNELTQRVDGGRMLQTSLFTVYLRDDGTVFAGAVPQATLLAAAR